MNNRFDRTTIATMERKTLTFRIDRTLLPTLEAGRRAAAVKEQDDRLKQGLMPRRLPMARHLVQLGLAAGNKAMKRGAK